ncbi:expressed unknown protein [Seminavis robusta]|uniref:G-protein coupled receptors family 1 profile domain-containing protein n=1 Tax=Seminavis robusta TaxID=568900 RepID=A0A9N8HR59_9STRA|nr:expressed unknown protein [Seminavis robusta]|eukprot:Sro1047_g235190.1 n/a (454) ;mRNA; r:30345-31786
MNNTENEANITQRTDETDDIITVYKSEEQAKLFAILPKPFALLSIFCSYVMIREIVAEHRLKKGRPVLRMLLAMAVADIFYSFAYFLGTWPAPPDVEHNMYGNVGSQGFCTFQGFIMSLGIQASVLSNAALSIYYLNIIIYRKTDRDLEKTEIYLQSLIWILAFVLAIYPIPLELYNPETDLCTLQSAPRDCSGEDCIRGSDPLIHLIIAMAPPLVCLLVSMSIMVVITMNVRKLENKSRKYGASSIMIQPPPFSAEGMAPRGSAESMVPHGSARASMNSGDVSDFFMGDVPRSRVAVRRTLVEVDRHKSQAAAMQAICYAIAFLMTYLLSYISVIKYLTTGTWNVILDNFAFSVFQPSAGTFNYIVFARVRMMKTPEGKLLKTFFCCTCLQKDQETARDSTSQSKSRKTTQQQQQQQPNAMPGESDSRNQVEFRQASSDQAASGSYDEGLVE